ncbi:MAG: tRNA (adenosine(37)-N6)-threonylcarbamoyltransferase complex ATPase subunit type 1 TsaE [Dermatophilaceae bacterium]
MAEVRHLDRSAQVIGTLRLPTPSATRALGERLARVLRRGDVVLLTGQLGAGKTTLTQGIGAGLRVRGPVTSPTFVLSRVHPALGAGPDLVHVDAYRLASSVELDDLDIDADLDHSVVVVEWGHGVAEQLSGDRLEVFLDGEGERAASIIGIGPRWTHPAASSAVRAILAAPLA